MRWTTLCEQHAHDAEQCAPLRAFQGAEEAGFASFGALCDHAAALTQALPARIVSVLSAEVDQPQAEMFARRFRSVAGLIAALPHPAARLLSIGLAMRAAEILGAPPPRALRVRAVVDFFYSQAAVLYHRRPEAPSVAALVQAAVGRPVAPGILHTRVSGLTRQGPVHLNVLRARGARIETLDCRGQGSLAQVVAAHGAVAGVSGGFFLYSEPDIAPPSRRTDPVGLLIHQGTVHSPPIWRRSALVRRGDHAHEIAQLGLEDAAVCWPGQPPLRIDAVNDPLAEGVVAFTRAGFSRSPPRPGACVSIVGGAVVARGEGSLEIPLAGVVLSLPGAAPRGDRVRWVLHAPAAEAIAGGPRLLRSGAPEIDLRQEEFSGTAPPITFSKDETFDQNLLPRMAAGLTADGDLIFAAIDGRNFEQAPGMTLRQTAALCAALGCVEAVNLDGGSSKRMVVGGRVVDLTSTEVVTGSAGPARVRPVNTAVLLFSGGGG